MGLMTSPGKMRKKVWCNQGDIVLVSLRDFQDLDGMKDDEGI
jgi:initiation factor 1A